ncbi:MAG TPA: nucleotidyltransferase [Bryobacteraceae bacterium]|nr:nucleotidyltransferase [Bryobacteraceae bacterium]
MTESPHFKELLQVLDDYRVEYLIVGGYAVMKYTEPRYTKDLDVWVDSSPPNAARLFRALAKFGAPLQDDGITAETFTQEGIVYQMGVAPVRIDILTRISGVQFALAWRSRIASAMFGVPVHFISLDDLIANKQAAARSTDLEDLKRIQEQMKEDKSKPKT